MTIEEQLHESLAASVSLAVERDDLRATVEKLTVGAADELNSAKIEIAAKDVRLGELTAAVDGLSAEVVTLKATLAALEAGKVSASKEAAKIAASVGVEPTAIIPGSDNVAAKVDALATFNALTDPVAKADFFAKNAQAIYASIKV